MGDDRSFAAAAAAAVARGDLLGVLLLAPTGEVYDAHGALRRTAAAGSGSSDDEDPARITMDDDADADGDDEVLLRLPRGTGVAQFFAAGLFDGTAAAVMEAQGRGDGGGSVGGGGGGGARAGEAGAAAGRAGEAAGAPAAAASPAPPSQFTVLGTRFMVHAADEACVLAASRARLRGLAVLRVPEGVLVALFEGRKAGQAVAGAAEPLAGVLRRAGTA